MSRQLRQLTISKSTDIVHAGPDATTAAVTTAESDTVSDTSTEGNERSQGTSRSEAIAQTLRCALTEAGAEYFHTPDRDAFVALNSGGRRETWRVRSDDLASWLKGACYVATRRSLPVPVLHDFLGTLEAQAVFEGAERTVDRRIAYQDGKIFVDLCNDRGEVVEITASGWQVISECPVHFVRSRNMSPLVSPIRGGDIGKLRDFLNVSDDGFVLVVSFLVGVLRGRGPYPLLIVNGEQGSAKSTLTKICRELVDPSIVPLRSIPKTEQDLMIAAANSALLSFDNLSHLPQSFSDALCRLSTGGGSGGRRLYSDAEEHVIDAKRPVILNGIEALAIKGDLAERSIVILLDRIPEELYEPETEYWERFGEMAPSFLGALLDAVVHALANERRISPKRLPRMADFARWILAAEPILPWVPGEFLAAYERSRTDADRSLLEGTPIARAILTLCRKRWRGTATQLLEQIGTNHSRHWPATARAMSDSLRRISTALRRLGCLINQERQGHNRDRIIVLGMAPAAPPSGFDSEDAPEACLSAQSAPEHSHETPGFRESADDADDASPIILR